MLMLPPVARLRAMRCQQPPPSARLGCRCLRLAWPSEGVQSRWERMTSRGLLMESAQGAAAARTLLRIRAGAIRSDSAEQQSFPLVIMERGRRKGGLVGRCRRLQQRIVLLLHLLQVGGNAGYDDGCGSGGGSSWLLVSALSGCQTMLEAAQLLLPLGMLQVKLGSRAAVFGRAAVASRRVRGGGWARPPVANIICRAWAGKVATQVSAYPGTQYST